MVNSQSNSSKTHSRENLIKNLPIAGLIVECVVIKLLNTVYQLFILDCKP